MKAWKDLFTPRQLVALTTFADLVDEARDRIREDALRAGRAADDTPLSQGGTGAQAYADAVATYLGFAVDKLSDASSSITSWTSQRDTTRNTFARQAIPMVWDFAEVNSFSQSTGNFLGGIEWGVGFLNKVQARGSIGKSAIGIAMQEDATVQQVSQDKIISTDPPYYDNIGYADLSDYFYVWLRRSLRSVHPELFATMAVPKAEELVATPYRHGSKGAAERFFLEGMTQAMQRLAEQAHSDFPVTIYYAFKQSETSTEGTSSTGWAAFLEAVMQAGFAITGTWPVRTERSARSVGIGTNALASSVVLVCQRRDLQSEVITRADLLRQLQQELPPALTVLQQGNVAPVDLPQSSIGPGMAVFSRHARVLEPDGSAMSVKTALQLINKEVEEFLEGQESELDDWTRFAVTWFTQYGYATGRFGDAQNIATAKGVTVDGVVEAGILESHAGKVRILQLHELEENWRPSTDRRLTVWEIVHYLYRAFDQGGYDAAASLLQEAEAHAEEAKALCYRLFAICEQKKWAEDARVYNTLIAEWPEMVKRMGQSPVVLPAQGQLI